MLDIISMIGGVLLIIVMIAIALAITIWVAIGIIEGLGILYEFYDDFMSGRG